MDTSFAITLEREVFRSLEIQMSSIIVETVTYGLYVGIFMLSTYSIVQRGFDRRANILMLLITTCMFIVGSSHWGLSVLYTILDVRFQSYRFIEANPVYPSSLLYTQIIQAYLSFIMYIMNDAVVLWRAWLFCGQTGRKAIYVVSALTLVVEIGLAVSSIAMLPPNWDSLLQQMTVNGSPEEFGTYRALVPFYIACCITFFTNTWATSIVSYQAWQHRKLVKEFYPWKGTMVTKVLTLLVESGTLYCLVWVICLTLFLARTVNSNVNHDSFSWVEVFYTDWKLVMNQITGIYPTLIIVLVCMKKTFHENVSASPVDVWTSSRIEDKVMIPSAAPGPQHRPLSVPLSMPLVRYSGGINAESKQHGRPDTLSGGMSAIQEGAMLSRSTDAESCMSEEHISLEKEYLHRV